MIFSIYFLTAKMVKKSYILITFIDKSTNNVIYAELDY